jgi:hypothetical protein
MPSGGLFYALDQLPEGTSDGAQERDAGGIHGESEVHLNATDDRRPIRHARHLTPDGLYRLLMLLKACGKRIALATENVKHVLAALTQEMFVVRAAKDATGHG